MVELSYSQVLADGAFETQVGFYPLGNEFGHFAPLCKFQSGTACGHLKNLPSSSGWNDYPTVEHLGQVLRRDRGVRGEPDIRHVESWL